MLPSERRKKILELLSEKDVATISELIETFNISIETIRRDLNILDREGKIEKIYGGAKIKESSFTEPTMESRMVSRLMQKERIGKKCSEFINNGDCIFIDSGSTTYQIAKHISSKKNLTIITNSIPVVNELINTDFEIIIIGGKIRKSERSVVTYEYLFNFSQLNIQKSFLCASGITDSEGISDFSMQEVITRKMIIRRSQEVYIAVDSSKFGKNVTINIAPIDQLDYIITDSEINKNIMKEFNKTKTKIIVS